jgi:hypothetical protein
METVMVCTKGCQRGKPADVCSPKQEKLPGSAGGPFLSVFWFSEDCGPSDVFFFNGEGHQHFNLTGKQGFAGAAPFRDTILIRQSELFSSVIVLRRM